MKVSGTTILVVLGAAFAVWLAADAMSDNRDAASRSIVRQPAVDARGGVLANEIARLHERLAPSAAPIQSGRNLFRFPGARPRHEASPARPALSEALPVAPPAAPVPPFTLIGIAEDTDASGPIRTAIVSAPGQLFTVKEGQNLTPRYRVEKIAAEVVELLDLVDHSTLRLALK
jgi:hypothetical protein